MSLHPTVGCLKPESEIAAWWRQIYGSLEVPLRSPLTLIAETAGQEHRCYLIDVTVLTPEQLSQVALVMAAKFNIPHKEVLEELARGAPLPIRESEISTVTFDGRAFL